MVLCALSWVSPSPPKLKVRWTPIASSLQVSTVVLTRPRSRCFLIRVIISTSPVSTPNLRPTSPARFIASNASWLEVSARPMAQSGTLIVGEAPMRSQRSIMRSLSMLKVSSSK